MLDKQGRNIDYIRISVTDRCNLRCRYCMPEEGVKQVCHDHILRFDEILRLVNIFAQLGIKKVKLTGGEPLVRKGLPSLVADIKKIKGIEQVTLTTNGLLLEDNLQSLVDAGLDGVNISLDTLSDDTYREITRNDGLEKVLAALDACSSFTQLRVKINAVTLADYNMGEIETLAELARNRNIDVRFIELMPMGLGRDFRGYRQELILERLTAAFGQPVISAESHGNGPAVYCKFSGFKGNVGFISALSHTFCGTCNRIRLTSEGFLKPCLNYAEGADLRAVLRGGAGDETIKTIIKESILNKPSGHSFGRESELKKDLRKMSDIGG